MTGTVYRKQFLTFLSTMCPFERPDAESARDVGRVGALLGVNVRLRSALFRVY